MGVGECQGRTVVKSTSPKDRLNRLGLRACSEGRCYPKRLSNILVVHLVSWADGRLVQNLP